MPVLEVRELSTGAVLPPADEVIELAAGGHEDRELGVPFLPGMAEVVVSAASMQLQGVPLAREPEGWAATERPGEGHLVQLAQPAKLRAIVVDTPTIDPTLTDVHVVVRPAQPTANGGWDIGPPMFASPSFWVGDLYPNALAGLDEWTEAGGRTRFSFPNTQGSGWLLHWATGDEPTKLAFLAVTTTVRSVTVEPAASGVRLALRADDAGDEVLLWQFPSAFTPDAGVQPVDFTPIAAKRLNARLALANQEPTPPPTLSLPVRLSADAGGPIGVSDAALNATYRVPALDAGANEEPMTLKLRGDWEQVTLRAPAALRPQAGTLGLTGHHLGRERNGPLTPPALPGGPGRTVTGDRWESTSLRVAPAGAGADAAKAGVTIVSVAVDVASDEPAELVAELRADLHGGPGRVLASAVAQLEGGTRAWTELDLGAGVPPAKPGWRLWLALRTNHGAVRWYAEDREGAEVRTSLDRGETWAASEDVLAGSSGLRARLFHAVAGTPSALPLAIYAGTKMLPELTLTRAPGQATEFSLSNGEMPDSLLDLLGRAGPTAGGTTVETVLQVASAAVLDITLRAADLTYSPTARPTDA
jgi:hypothetical protein